MDLAEAEGGVPSLYNAPTEGEIINVETSNESEVEHLLLTAAPAPVSLKVRSLAAGQVDRTVAAALPEGMHLSKEARIAFHKAATMFVLYLSCLAEDERSRESRRRVTLSSNDIKAALKAAGMSHLIPLLSTGHMKRGRTNDNFEV